GGDVLMPRHLARGAGTPKLILRAVPGFLAGGKTLLRVEGGFDGRDDRLRFGRHSGSERRPRLSIATDQNLVEIPARLGLRAQRLPHPAIKWVCRVALDRRLLCQRKRDVEGTLTERQDLRVGAGLLLEII